MGTDVCGMGWDGMEKSCTTAVFKSCFAGAWDAWGSVLVSEWARSAISVVVDFGLGAAGVRLIGSGFGEGGCVYGMRAECVGRAVFWVGMLGGGMRGSLGERGGEGIAT